MSFPQTTRTIGFITPSDRMQSFELVEQNPTGIEEMDDLFCTYFLKMNSRFPFNPEVLYYEYNYYEMLDYYLQSSIESNIQYPPNQNIGHETIYYGSYGTGNTTLTVKRTIELVDEGECVIVVGENQSDVDYLENILNINNRTQYVKMTSLKDNYSRNGCFKLATSFFKELCLEYNNIRLIQLPQEHALMIVHFLQRYEIFREDDFHVYSISYFLSLMDLEKNERWRLCGLTFQDFVGLYLFYTPPSMIICTRRCVASFTNNYRHVIQLYSIILIDDASTFKLEQLELLRLSPNFRHLNVELFGNVNSTESTGWFMETLDADYFRSYFNQKNWTTPPDICEAINMSLSIPMDSMTLDRIQKYPLPDFMPDTVEYSSIVWYDTILTEGNSIQEVEYVKKLYEDLEEYVDLGEYGCVLYNIDSDKTNSKEWMKEHFSLNYNVIDSPTGRHYQYIFLLATKKQWDYDVNELNQIFSRVCHKIFVFGNRDHLELFKCWSPFCDRATLSLHLDKSRRKYLQFKKTHIFADH